MESSTATTSGTEMTSGSSNNNSSSSGQTSSKENSNVSTALTSPTTVTRLYADKKRLTEALRKRQDASSKGLDMQIRF